METALSLEDMSVGDTEIPYEDDEVTMKVVRVSEKSFMIAYRRTDTGENLFVMQVNTGSKPNSISELDRSFWTITVDGEEYPADRVEEILSAKNIASTGVRLQDREIAFETE
jgi:hypothetical protein